MNYEQIKVENLPKERIVDLEFLIKKYSEGMRFALTFGTFDLFHIFHALYINAIAQTRPDLTLVVGIDSDENTKKRKGDKRPIQEFLVRALSALVMTKADYVFKHEGNDLEVIKKLLPLLVVYSETTTQESIESRQPVKDFIESYGGKLGIGEARNELGISTSSIIKRVLEKQ